jgi:hypothetical protein
MGQTLRQVAMPHGPVRTSEQSGDLKDREWLAQCVILLRVMLRVALPWVGAQELVYWRGILALCET